MYLVSFVASMCLSVCQSYSLRISSHTLYLLTFLCAFFLFPNLSSISGFIYYPQMYLSARFFCSVDNRTHQNHFLRLSESRDRWQVGSCVYGGRSAQKDIPSPAIINKIKCAFVWTNWIMCVWMPRFHGHLPFHFPVFFWIWCTDVLALKLSTPFLLALWRPVKFYGLSEQFSPEMASFSSVHPHELFLFHVWHFCWRNFACVCGGFCNEHGNYVLWHAFTENL